MWFSFESDLDLARIVVSQNHTLQFLTMAFFNLTVLGPQNIFQEKDNFLYLFTRKDLETAFRKITGDEEHGEGKTHSIVDLCFRVLDKRNLIHNTFSAHGGTTHRSPNNS